MKVSTVYLSELIRYRLVQTGRRSLCPKYSKMSLGFCFYPWGRNDKKVFGYFIKCHILSKCMCLDCKTASWKWILIKNDFYDIHVETLGNNVFYFPVLLSFLLSGIGWSVFLFNVWNSKFRNQKTNHYTLCVKLNIKVHCNRQS